MALPEKRARFGNVLPYQLYHLRGENNIVFINFDMRKFSKIQPDLTGQITSPLRVLILDIQTIPWSPG